MLRPALAGPEAGASFADLTPSHERGEGGSGGYATFMCAPLVGYSLATEARYA